MGNLVTVVQVLGGFWVVLCIMFAGMKLSAAQGSNPQARTAGFIGIAMAFIGGFVIIQAHSIAGYISAL
ncbi:hypothetical protein KH400_15895 [Desertibacillus haloalkaliphilus]|nr:hypothetical protein [Desertibacillus haloalkaliphilus]